MCNRCNIIYQIACTVSNFWVVHPDPPFSAVTQIRALSSLKSWLWTWCRPFTIVDYIYIYIIYIYIIYIYIFIYLFRSLFTPEKCTFPTTKTYSWFFIFVSDLVFINFRDSTYNFRLIHLILDYIIKIL